MGLSTVSSRYALCITGYVPVLVSGTSTGTDAVFIKLYSINYHKYSKGNSYKPNLKSEDIKAVNKNLKLTCAVAIAMDKTKSCMCIHIDDYKNWAIKHLLKNGKEIRRSKLVQVFEDANKLLESLEHIMSEDQYFFMK
jgi:hypothetical protein